MAKKVGDMNKCFLLALAFSLFGAQLASAQPSRVILIRHAEKPADDTETHLSPRGYERAKALVAFFSANTVIHEKGAPDFLIAMPTKKDGSGSVRAIETLQPLATSLQKEIDLSAKKKELKELAQKLLADEKYNGKVVVVCWNHDGLPEVAKGLGLGEQTPGWDPKVFDRAWIIDFAENKISKFQDIPQHLLDGDSQEAVTTPANKF
jgi:phosphohistidine phosphatase SixA